MTAVETGYDRDPLDLDAPRRQAEEEERRKTAALIERRRDLASKLSGRRGRREVRRLFADGRLDVDSDAVPTDYDRHYGEMVHREATRHRALETIWPLMRALAAGEVELESFRLLMTETDA